MNTVRSIIWVVLFVIIGLYIVAGFLPSLVSVSDDVRVNPQTDVRSCTTAAGATTCNVTLSAAHAHADTSRMTITETSPGSTTRSGTLNNNDRTTLTVTGLSPATAYTFSVAYRVVDTNLQSEMASFLGLWPFLAVLLFAGVILFFGWQVVKR